MVAILVTPQCVMPDFYWQVAASQIWVCIDIILAIDTWYFREIHLY